MRFDVLTLFPEIFQGYLGQSILKLALERGLVEIHLWNIRDWAKGRHKSVDDRPFGGGPGMVLMPEPRRAITTPVNTWTRSFCPSRMRWWTSTWSPIWNCGTSFRAAASSTNMISLFFIVASLPPLGTVAGPAAGLGLLLPPAGHRLVVAADQHVGHGHAAEDPRPGVLRVLQPARVAVGLLPHAVRVPQDAGHVADDRIDKDHGGHFAAVAHVVADRDLTGPQPQPDALVEPLVAPAEQDQPAVAGQFAD